MVRLSTREVLAGTLTFGSGVLCTFLVDILRHVVADEVVGWNTWSVAVISGCLLIVCITMLYSLEQLRDMRSKNRLTVRYFGIEAAVGMRELAGFVRRLEEGSDYLVVNYLPKAFTGSVGSESEKERREYFRALEKKFGKCNYRRIIQVDPSAPNWADQTYIDHLREVIKFRDSAATGHTLQVSEVPLRYPTAFVIIKNPSGTRYLSLDIFEHTLVGQAFGSLKLIGSLHITDPDELLIEPFERLFRNLESSKGLRVVGEGDLITQAASPVTLPPPAN